MFTLIAIINGRQVYGKSLIRKVILNYNNCKQIIDFHFKTHTKNTCFSTHIQKQCFSSDKRNAKPLSVVAVRHQHRDYRHVLKLANQSRNKSIVLYATAFVLMVIAGTYASVPLYRIYCQSTGKGGKPFINEAANEKILAMKKTEERLITVTFSAETTSAMAWHFKPTQPEIRCSPGETVLAFFTARNPLDRPIDGIATYTVQPFEAGSYLNKIQCFCFEEQRLNPQEEVDLPVFFYIDPEYAKDPRLENVEHIILSYTFFEAKKGMTLPSFMSPQKPPVEGVGSAVGTQSSLALQKL